MSIIKQSEQGRRNSKKNRNTKNKGTKVKKQKERIRGN
jgi:hypothetical protein